MDQNFETMHLMRGAYQMMSELIMCVDFEQRISFLQLTILNKLIKYQNRDTKTEILKSNTMFGNCVQILIIAVSVQNVCGGYAYNNIGNNPIPRRHYRAAIASWQHSVAANSSEYIASINGMNKLVVEAAADGAQIIVFPETTINSALELPADSPWKVVQQSSAEYIPYIGNDTETFDYVTPCGNTSWANRPLSQLLSCSAKENQIYVVVNMNIALPCSGEKVGDICPLGEIMLMNAMVSFNPKGKVVGRFYKRHLAEEAPGFTQPTPQLLAAYPDNPVLQTDFGVRFGMFICFDLGHPYPMNNYLEDNVTNMIWSNEWITTPIFGTQLGLGQGLAATMGINILASGTANYKTNGVAAFSADRVLAMSTSPSDCIDDDFKTINPKCLGYAIADVPKIPTKVRKTDYFEYFDIPQSNQTFPCAVFSPRVFKSSKFFF